MTINKIKAIERFEIEFPVEKGLYAITGQNGSGKSTVITCASSVFFNMIMNDYFGKTDNDSFIQFEYNNAKRLYKKISGRWVRQNFGNVEIKGFYEGSIIYGNRFRNTNYQILRKLEMIDERLLKPAPDFIKDNLGLILHNNKNFYEEMFRVDGYTLRNIINVNGDIFYYQKGIKRISQFHMSTGENLLVSILNSLNIRNLDRSNRNIPCLLVLDEIELALHPSSLKRLVTFLNDISKRYNYAVYFSTHSIELISSIKPENIFFLDRHTDNTIEIINPCYPAYATRILYDHSGYDNIILVEDDLSREIIRRILRKNALLTNKLVHVLPCGGYSNVIELAQEVISSNLVGKISNISIILDADIKTDAENFIAKTGISNNIPLNYLPIESLEKYLKTNLCVNVDHKLFRLLNDYIFHQVSLNQIIEEYKNSGQDKSDRNGKKLYQRIDDELRARNRNRSEIIEMIVDYLDENGNNQMTDVVEFLKKQFE